MYKFPLFVALFSEVDSFGQNNTEIRIWAFRFVFFKMALRGELQEDDALFVICDRYTISTKMLVNTILLTTWLLGITAKLKPTSSQSHKCINESLTRKFGMKQVDTGTNHRKRL